MIERILEDLYRSNNSFKIAILRYLNPVGTHPSGTIGEDTKGIPNTFMPFITQTAVGKREYLSVFGNDYETHDGTGVRDYIHVVDLANAHVKAIDYLTKQLISNSPLTVNIGTGKSYFVLDMIKVFAKETAKKITYEIVKRREGDIAKCYANASCTKEILDWKATKDIDDMCVDSWRWQVNNPEGYK